MKRILYFIAFIVLFSIQGPVAMGQRVKKPTSLNLTVKDYKQMEEMVFTSVDMLNDYIKYMAEKERKIRDTYKKMAKKLFIHQCCPFNEVLKDSTGKPVGIIENDGVTMQLASLQNNRVYFRLMREYFTNLINLDKTKYKAVHIGFSDVASMKMSNPTYIGKDEDGNDMYECSVTYVQYFRGVTKEGIICEDLTTKTIQCRVSEYFEPNFETGKLDARYDVLLGNVYVDKIEPADIKVMFELRIR